MALFKKSSLPCWTNIDMLLTCDSWLIITDFFEHNKVWRQCGKLV